MKAFKRLVALMLVALMTLSLSACIHKKGEIAVTVKDVEFTSAYYMVALINAKSEAQQKVNESLTDEEKEETIDYFKKKIDKKDFSEWVEERAVEMLEEIAAYKLLCKENKLEISDEQKDNASQTVEFYWTSYGYSTIFEPNGVSKETYLNFMTDSYYSELYFESLYGKEGTKALKSEDVNKEITDNYIIVDKIDITFEEETSDEDVLKSKQLLEGYANDIKSGKKSFIEIYKAHNEIEDEETTEETDEVEPINIYATVYGSEDTNFADSNYANYKSFSYDAPQIVESEDGTTLSLVIKRDISKDQYFMDSLDIYARHSLADEDYEKEIEEYSKDLKAKVNKYAVGQFKVKNIIEPSYS